MNSSIQDKVDALIKQQLSEWPLAKSNFDGLQKVITREMVVNNQFVLKIQFNPERIRSSAAKVDARSIKERKCFLCPANLPAEQKGIEALNDYLILVNPYPIFSRHLTIPLKQHLDQRIEGRFAEMLLLAELLPDFVVFYNGPQCGASAPDHFHFQAGNKGFMPIEQELLRLTAATLRQTRECRLTAIDNYLRKALVMTGSDRSVLEQWFQEIMDLLKHWIPSTPEPMLNILAFWTGKEWQVVLFPRKKHRPDQFYREGDEQILLSPASVDFGGVLITPREADYYKLNETLIMDIFEQVTIGDEEWEALKDRL